MMASPSDQLTLDCKPHNSYSTLLESFGDQNFNITVQTQKLEDFLSRLEQERLKIDAFKRELPLCMQLLTNAVKSSRQQLQTYRANQGPQPILEEFIPLRQSNSSSNGSEKTSNIMSDKANWMTSAQLWSQTNDGTEQHSPKQTDIGFIVSPKLDLDAKQRNGGAFHPFSKERNSLCSSPLNPPELALGAAEKLETQVKKCMETDNGMSCSRGENPNKGGSVGTATELGKGVIVPADSRTTTTTGTVATNTNSQTHRKARRCWSPDLHRRFVNALQTLGGSQAATPKQIRELMKVDGLTNDEVKSHLQKYRLHTRRLCPSPQAAGTPTPQLVILGGIWVPKEYAAAHHSGPPTLYGAHPTTHHSPHYPLPQEYYSPQPQAHHQLHHHTLHHQLHMYKPSPQTHSSPESDIRGNTGDRSETIDDGKSESSSWKADSGGQENGGERKGITPDGEESNGSDITLKF